MSQDVQALVLYRLSQADEALAAARAERAAGRRRSAINRAYYAMFYASLALLTSRQVGTSKHSGVVARVSEHFIKTGLLPAEMGRALNQAFALRQKADYREFFEPTPDQVDQVLAWAAGFLAAARQLLGS